MANFVHSPWIWNTAPSSQNVYPHIPNNFKFKGNWNCLVDYPTLQMCCLSITRSSLLPLIPNLLNTKQPLICIILLSISTSYRMWPNCSEARRIQCRLAPMTNERFHNAYFSLLHTLYQHAGVHDNPTFFISW